MNFLHAILLLAAIALAQLFFGGGDGTRLIYTLPSCLLLGVSGLLALTSFRKAPARMDRGCLLSAVLLGVFMLVRIALSPSAWLARADFFMAVAALLAYFLTALCISGSRARSLVVAGLLVLGIAQAALGFYQFAREAGFHPLVEGGLRGATSRATGFFVNGNHLAGFIEAALLLAVSLCFWGGFRAIGKMLAGYAALVCLAGLLLTGSRGGYLSAAVGFAVFSTMSVWTLRARLSRRLLPRIIAVVAAIVLIGGALTWAAQRSPVIRDRANTVFSGLEVRPQLWEAAWKQFRLAPVFGTGSRTYAYYGRMFRDLQAQRETVSPHSDWLQLLAEYGIVGALLAACLMFAHLRHGGRRWLRMIRRHSQGVTGTDEARSLALQLGAISAIAALLVHAVVDFNFHIPSNLMVTAFLLGLLASRRARAEEQNPVWPRRTLHALPAGLGLWMIVLAAPRLPGQMRVESVRKKFAAGDIEAVLSNGAEALARGVRNPELHFQIGEVKRVLSLFMNDGEGKRAMIGEAHDAYAAALAIYPQDVKFVVRDVWALSRLGRFEEAEPLLARAKELDPKSPTPWVYSALHWHLRGRPAEALADYRRADGISGGMIPGLLTELGEKLDPQELERLAKSGQPAP